MNLRLSEPTLVALLESVSARRDDAAFVALFEFYAPRLSRFFAARGARPPIVDDLIQETMMTLWRKTEQYDPRLGTPSGWVFTIARNLVVTSLRSRRIESLEYDLASIEDPKPLADRLIAASQLSESMRQVLSTLPEERLSLLNAAFFEGKSHGQIARERQMPVGTVKSHLRRALALMRSALLDSL